MPEFVRRTRVEHPVDEVFGWHMRPGALERLIPPWDNVEILSRSGTPADGGEILFRVRRGPTDMKLAVKHVDYEEGVSFRDVQTRGPFTRWVHTHRFEATDDGACMVEDHIDWELPLGLAGRLLGGSTVEHELERMFTFRHGRLINDLARMERYRGDRALRVGVTGSTGLIGTALCAVLTTSGHKVVRMRRMGSPVAPDEALWNPNGEPEDLTPLEGLDAVVHLAGEPLLGLRWTEEKKKRIWKSRVKGTEWLARTLAQLKRPPRVLVSSSAVGFYGDRGNEVLTESSGPGKGFLSDLCQAWEEATRPAARMAIRVVTLRTGLVLTPAGGALGTMLLPFKVGVGGRLGSGRQYVSWIDHDDMISLILHSIRTDTIRGAVNATTPYPVPNATFSSTLGRVLDRPTLIPIPSFAVKALFGEMGTETLLSSARARPTVAEETGFEFAFPGLEESLRHQLGLEVAKPE